MVSCGFGRISWIDIEINAATAAENKPVFDLTVSYVKHKTGGRKPTNIRIPSASAFQPSAIFLSSSLANSKYIEKISPALSKNWHALSDS